MFDQITIITIIFSVAALIIVAINVGKGTTKPMPIKNVMIIGSIILLIFMFVMFFVWVGSI